MNSSHRGSITGLAGASYLSLLLGLVTGPVLARAVGPSGRGEIALVVVVSGLFAALAGLGVPLAVGHSAANGLQPPGRLVSSALRLAVWQLPVAFVISLGIVYGILDLSESSSEWAAVGLLSASPLTALVLSMNMIFMGHGFLRPVLVIQLTRSFGVAVLVVALYAAGVLSVSIYFLVITGMVGVVVAVAFRNLAGQLGPPVRLTPLLRFGRRGYLGYMATHGTIQIDQLFIGAIAGEDELGFYAVAVAVAQLPVILGRSVASRALGSVVRLGEEQQTSGASEYVRMGILVSLMMAGALAILAWPGVPLLYGANFAPSVVPLLWLLPGSILLCGSLISNACLVAVGRPGQTTIAEAVGLGTTLVGVPVIVPVFGIAGAAAFSSVTYLGVFLAYRKYLRELGVERVWPGRNDVRRLAAEGRGFIVRVTRRATTLRSGRADT